ncbi:MAG: TolB family protein [Actinomycetota bacterium]
MTSRIGRLPPAVGALAAGAVLAVVLLVPAPAGAAFPGRNGLIAWTHPTSLTTDAEIFVMTPNGRRIRQLSHNEQNDFFPAWSADGRWVAFESASATDVDVWVMNLAGTVSQNISQMPGVADRGPAWSPDGERIAFWRQHFDGTSGIWRMNADGSNQVRLTADANIDSYPAWSPDGRWIAFVSERDGNPELYVMPPEGSPEIRLTRTPMVAEGNPNWSPDGRKLAFDACYAASFPCPGTAPNYEIFTVNVNGTGLRRLTNEPGIDFNPAWSPDGTEIVFRSDRTGFTHIWKMDADGTDETQLTTVDFTGGVDPDWQPIP